ncbi:MAG: hypothetical protein AAF843_13720 [Bacteroidota bacterium]
MKTIYLSLVLSISFVYPGMACVLPIDVTVDISGPSSVIAGNQINLSATKSGDEFYVDPTPVSGNGSHVPIGVTWTIKNSSGAVVIIEHWTSANVTNGNVLPNIEGPYNTSLTLPPGLAVGTYQAKVTLTWVSERQNGFEDYDQTEDSYQFQVTEAPINADLEAVFQNTTAVNVTERANFTFSFAVNNTGEALNPNTEVDLSFYWSEDNIIDNNDVVARTISDVAVTNGFGINWQTTTVTIPEVSLDNTIRRLIMKVDPQNEIEEPGAENNNTDSRQFVISNSTSGGRIKSDLDISDILTSKRDLNGLNLLKVIDVTGRMIWEKSSEERMDYLDLPTSELLILVMEKENSITTKKVVLTE